MRVLVVSGIWPPDVGGPASHGPEVAAFLQGRGHSVEVVTTADRVPPAGPAPVHWVDRRLPKGLIHVRGAALVARRAARADVVYTTGMFGRTAGGARIARTPYVVKLTADPAYERARRRGFTKADLDGFQGERAGLTVRLLLAVRDASLRDAARIVCPSAYLRDLVVSWGVDGDRVEVLPNPLPALPPAALAPREECRRRLGLEGPTLAFAGRLAPQKSLQVALAALAAVHGISLVVAGEGDERPMLEQLAAELRLDGRVRFVGTQPRERVLELFRAADAMILSSHSENFPHTVLEALAVGTPVVATAVGGVTEVVRDGENGLLVRAGDPEALAGAIARYFADATLRANLRAAAAPSVAGYAPDRVYARLEQILTTAAGR